MNNCGDRDLFNNLTCDEEMELAGGLDGSFFGALTSSSMMPLESFASQGTARRGREGSSSGVVVDMNLSAILVSAFIGRLFGLQGNALSWYMLMNSVSLRWR